MEGDNTTTKDELLEERSDDESPEDVDIDEILPTVTGGRSIGLPITLQEQSIIEWTPEEDDGESHRLDQDLDRFEIRSMSRHSQSDEGESFGQDWVARRRRSGSSQEESEEEYTEQGTQTDCPESGPDDLGM